MIRALSLAMVVALSSVGCASVSFAPSKAGYQAVVVASPDQVEVYRTEKPEHSYVEIGAISYPGGKNLEKLLTKMKEEASRRGGNAIIDLQITSDGAVGTVVRVEK